jgi:hypothetical protein
MTDKNPVDLRPERFISPPQIFVEREGQVFLLNYNWGLTTNWAVESDLK